ncbi:hypothetical protein JCM6882_003440 [Rhodosporidiobolus microsporus]
MFARASLSAARSAARAPTPAARRAFHVDNVINNTTPFDQTNGAKLGFYMIAFFGGGFATPFIACAFQNRSAPHQMASAPRRRPQSYTLRALLADIDAVAARAGKRAWAVSLKQSSSSYWDRWSLGEKRDVEELFAFWKRFPPERLPAAQWTDILRKATNSIDRLSRRRRIAEAEAHQPTAEEEALAAAVQEQREEAAPPPTLPTAPVALAPRPPPRRRGPYTPKDLVADLRTIAARTSRPVFAAVLCRDLEGYWPRWSVSERRDVEALMAFWKRFPPERLPASDWTTMLQKATSSIDRMTRKRRIAEADRQEAGAEAAAASDSFPSRRDSTSPPPPPRFSIHHYTVADIPPIPEEGERPHCQGRERRLSELARRRWHARVTPRTAESALTAHQLALAHLHPDYTDALADQINRAWFRLRERARNRRRAARTAGAGVGGEQQVQLSDDDRFALQPLDFPLDGPALALESDLSDEQLLVVQFHPEAGEVEVLKAERTLRKRRERAIALNAQEEETAREEAAQAVQPLFSAPTKTPAVEDDRVGEDVKPNLAHFLKLQQHEKARDRLPTPATSATSAVAQSPPLASSSQPPFVPPPPAPQPDPTPPRPQKRPRTPSPPPSSVLPPLPDRYDPLPPALSSLFHSLRLSNLPTASIPTRAALVALFPPPLQPDASILYQPSDGEGGVSRTAVVGYLEWEKRTEAMQEVLKVRLGRWDVKSELVDPEGGEEGKKARWEWGDLASEELRVKLWREECARERGEQEKADQVGVDGVEVGEGEYELDYGDGDGEGGDEDEDGQEEDSLLVPPDETSPVLPLDDLPSEDDNEAGTPPHPPPSALPSLNPSPAPSYASAISLTAPSFTSSPAPRSRAPTRPSSRAASQAAAAQEMEVIVLDDDFPPSASAGGPSHPSPAPAAYSTSSHPPLAPGSSTSTRTRSRPRASRRSSSTSSSLASTSRLPAEHSPHHPTLLARTTSIDVHGVAAGSSSSGSGKAPQKRASEEGGAGLGLSLLDRLGAAPSSSAPAKGKVRAEEEAPQSGAGPAKKKQKKDKAENHHLNSSASLSHAAPPPQRDRAVPSRGRGRGRGGAAAGPGPAFHPSAASASPSSFASSSTPASFSYHPPPSSQAQPKGPPPAFLPSKPPHHPAASASKQPHHHHLRPGDGQPAARGHGQGQGQERGRGRGKGKGGGEGASPAGGTGGSGAGTSLLDRLGRQGGAESGVGGGGAKSGGSAGGGGDLLSRLG